MNMSYEEFVTLYEANYQDQNWFFGEFHHIQQKYPQYVDLYIASNLLSKTKLEAAE